MRGRRKRQKEKRHERSPLKLVKEERKVAICTPSDDYVRAEYAVSLVRMVQKTILAQPDGLTHLTTLNYGSSILPFSRQMIATVALEQGVTHLLWIDSDMKFPDDTLLRFIRHDYPIIGINAMARRQPFRNTAQSSPAQQIHTRPESTGLEKVYRTGFGVIWIAAEVLRKIEPPWFDFEYVPDLGCWRGEDYTFAEKAREAGYEFYIDHDLSKEIMHMGSFGYNPMLMDFVENQVSRTDGEVS